MSGSPDHSWGQGAGGGGAAVPGTGSGWEELFQQQFELHSCPWREQATTSSARNSGEDSGKFPKVHLAPRGTYLFKALVLGSNSVLFPRRHEACARWVLCLEEAGDSYPLSSFSGGGVPAERTCFPRPAGPAAGLARHRGLEAEAALCWCGCQ